MFLKEGLKNVWFVWGLVHIYHTRKNFKILLIHLDTEMRSLLLDNVILFLMKNNFSKGKPKISEKGGIVSHFNKSV